MNKAVTEHNNRRPPHIYGKIYCEEGVVFEMRFNTEAEALAFRLGAREMLEAVDPEDDFMQAGVDWQPAIDCDALPEGTSAT